MSSGCSTPCTISIHVLRVEDDLSSLLCDGVLVISIHVLRVEDDSRLSIVPPCLPEISIHVLRVEDDVFTAEEFAPLYDISIHVLRVEDDSAQFIFCAVLAISIHVLRVEDDAAGAQWNYRAGRFQSTSSVWRTTAKTEKNLYLHSYNIAICTDLQSHQSVHAHVCTNNPKQSPQKPVRSIRVCGDCSMFARPSSPDGALRKSARHPAGRRSELRCVQPCFDNGCPAGKSADCPLPGRSIWPVQP